MQGKTMIEVYKTTEKLSNDCANAARGDEAECGVSPGDGALRLAGGDMAIAARKIMQAGQQRNATH